MMYDISTIPELIDDLGGNTALAERLGITSEAISNWKARGHIPPGWHWRLLAMARSHNKTVAPAVFGLDHEQAGILQIVA